MKYLSLFILAMLVTNILWEQKAIAQNSFYKLYDGQSSDEDCIESHSSVLDIENLLSTKCQGKAIRFRSERKQFCKCLEREAEDNYLIRELRKDQSSINKELGQMRDHYTKRFMSAYSQMTIEAAVQEKILGIKEKKQDEARHKEVGCDPQLLADNIEKAAKKHYEDRDVVLRRTLDERKKELNDCLNPSRFNKVLGRSGSCDSLKTSIDNIQKQIDSRNENADIEATCGQAAGALSKRTLQDKLTNAVIFYQKQKSDPAQVSKAEAYLKTIAELDLSPGMCHLSLIEAQDFLKTYDQDNAALGGIEFRKGQCKDNKDGLCSAIEVANVNLAEKVRRQFDHDPSKECVSYAEFKTFKGMPGPKFLDALRGKRKNVGDLLETPTDDSSELEKERLNFLRANPLIAKIAQGPLKDELGNRLKKLATEVEGMTEPQKFNAYLKFMKKDVKELAQDTKQKSTELFICHEMGLNFTAIQVADHLPEPESLGEVQNTADKLFRDIAACNRDQNNKDATTADLQKTLRMSPIFSLAPEDPEVEEKRISEEFDKFKGEHCKDYSSYVSKNCGQKSPKSCRQSYLKNSSFAENNETLQSNGVASSVSKDDVKGMMSGTDRSKQDRGFHDWWDENVGKKLSKNPIPMKGEEKAFQQRKEEDFNAFKVADIPERFENNSTAMGEINQSQTSMSNSTATSRMSLSEPISNPGQVLPKFSQNSFDPKALSKGEDVTEAIPQFKNLPPEKQINSLEEAKKYMEKNNWAPEEIQKAGVHKALNEAKLRLEDVKKRGEKLTKKESPSSQSSFTPPYGPAVADGTHIAPMPSMISKGKGATLSPGPKQRDAVNEALVSLHENSQVQVKDGVVDSKEFQGIQQSHQDLLVDTNKFELLRTDAKELEIFIKKAMNGVSIGDSKIITITDNSLSHPAPQLIYRVKRNLDGSFEIQSLPPNVPVQRKATLKSLRQSF